MPKAPEGYQPLLNRGTLGSLWLADDHLLVIETTRFLLTIRETYRRLDFTNIQAVLHTKSQRGTWLVVLFSCILCASLIILALAGFDSRPAQFAAGAMALPTLIALATHFIKGQTSALIIQTTVRPWRLKMVTRHSHVLQVLTALEPLCREAQKDIATKSPTPDPAATSAFRPFPPVPPPSADAPPSLAGAHPLAIPAWLCLLAFAAMMGGELIWNSMAATLLMIGFAAASFTLLMIAFTRGGGSLATGGRGVFLFGLSMLGASLVAGYAAAMAGVLQASIRGDESDFSAEEFALRALAQFPEGSPDGLSIAAMTIIALTGISAVTGLLAAARRNKLQRMSMEPTPPPSA
jgi:uncharacterized integral membrane protein